MASVVRIKRKVGEDPHVALIAAKRRRSDDGECAAAAGPVDTLLQFVGTMNERDTTLPAAVLLSVKSAQNERKIAKSGTSRRTACKPAGTTSSAKAQLRRERVLQQQKGRRFTVVAQRRDLAGELAGVIDIEESEPMAADMVGAPEVACNGQPMERVSVEASAAQFVYDLYLAAAPLAHGDGAELELHTCDDHELWEHRPTAGIDSDESPSSDSDSNAEDNWRNDYPDELDDSDYDRYLPPEDSDEFDLVRRLGAHQIASGDDDDEPLAYGLSADSGVNYDGAYDRYKSRVLRDMARGEGGASGDDESDGMCGDPEDL